MSSEKVGAAPRVRQPSRLAAILGGAMERPLIRHVAPALLVLGAFLALSYQVSSYTDYEAAGVAIFAIAAAGLTVLTGINGQISLGHGALMAVGAYTTALLLEWQPNLPMILVLAVSVAVTGITGLFFGVAAARLRGPYLAGVTLTLALALPQLALHFSSIFAGEQGIPINPPAAPAWLGANFDLEQWLAWVTVLAALVSLVLLANLLRSGVGRALRAVRDDEIAAQLAGIHVGRARVTAFVVSAACAGLAGSLFAYWLGLAAPGGFGVTLSLQLLIAIVIGGLGSLVGAVWGALFLILLPDLTSGLASTYNFPSSVSNNLPQAIFSVVLVLAILVFPSGIQGGLVRLGGLGRSRWRQLRAVRGSG
ncbi:MAG: branched-chain amino acid ABC transporter permease [Candidatus Dormibacteria bacterium]